LKDPRMKPFWQAASRGLSKIFLCEQRKNSQNVHNMRGDLTGNPELCWIEE
jgi:hypothetical protein